MIGSFLTSGLILALGYAYPAYECYKVVDKNKPEIEQLRFWCQYWILIAFLTIFERLGGDAFISWLPMYSEAKLVFYIYLWYPKTKGTAYVYDTFFQPYVAKHEVEIDRSILELRARAGDVAIQYMQKATTYGQTRFFEILQYVASQSQPSRSQPAQRRQQERTQQQVQKAPPPIVPERRPTVVSPPPTQQPANPSPPSPARSQVKEPDVPDPAAPTLVVPPSPSKTQLAPATSSISKQRSSQTSIEPPKDVPAKPSSLAESMQVDQEVAAATTSTSNEDSSSSNPNPNSTLNPKETVMEETLRVTRGRLRRARSIITPTATR